MTFRKDSILFVEQLCVLCFMVIVCIVMWLFTQDFGMAVIALCFILFVALMPMVHNEFVTIDYDEIRCVKNGKVIWVYTRKDIIKLKRSSRYRLPSVEIVIDEHANEIIPYDYSKHYFQLGQAARNALILYKYNIE